MTENLKSSFWPDAIELIRKCHLSSINPASVEESDWEKAFNLLVKAILDERTYNACFAMEFLDLTPSTGNVYGFEDILEEYFDHLEENEKWELVISSSEKMIELFKWEKQIPSEYLFRKGNALEKLKRYDEALIFGDKWMRKYPEDLYAVASNVFLLIELGKIKEAEILTAKHLKDDLICDNNSDTFFMAAIRLFEITDNAYAKQRVEKKIAEYNAMMNK